MPDTTPARAADQSAPEDGTPLPGEPPASYAEAEAELEAILRSLEADDVDVDELSASIARARGLITWCRGRLAAAEVTITELLADPDDET